MEETKTLQETTCFHCGELCPDKPLTLEDKKFCCEGCRTVYDILNKSGMCDYYDLNERPGQTQKKSNTVRYEFLDDEETSKKFITFRDADQIHVTFYIPAMHCSSCIWLLENLNRLHPKVFRSRVNFIKKELSIVFSSEIALSDIAKLLDRVGYPPHLSLNSLEEKTDERQYFNKSYFYKLGIAFFSFGNIMLLSFPDYFGIDSLTESPYRNLFGYLNFLLAIPVMFYSASEFFVSAWKGVIHKTLNMDFPIALGILIMFVRSSYDIFSGTGSGYMDTLASLVFLMLVGRALQNMTYGRLSFDRDYKSYFPVSVTLLEQGQEKNIPATQVKVGSRLLIRNNELIPGDAILFKGDAHIDYSFVTGESTPVDKTLGEIIFAGGKQIGNAIEVEVIKEVSQSYLTRLWNEDTFEKDKTEKDKLTSLSNRVSRWFTLIILIIASGAALYWLRTDSARALHAFTSVLIITCPCALALSTPFTLGNAMRILGKMKFYLKNTIVIEKLAQTDVVLFDKTGTITRSGAARLKFEGEELSDYDLQLIRSASGNSAHPLSRIIHDNIPSSISKIEWDTYEEISGKGIIAKKLTDEIKLGSEEWICGKKRNHDGLRTMEVHYAINGQYKGYFRIRSEYRDDLKHVIQDLQLKHQVKLVSGDNDGEKQQLLPLFGKEENMLFHQSPFEKLELVKQLQDEHKTVLMIGDGLNDAGALAKSNVGISVSENINNFSPACDAILDSESFSELPRFIRFSKAAVNVILMSFGLSFIYNLVGLWFAVQGNLSPLVAAILMPISSISVIIFTTIGVGIASRKIFKPNYKTSS
ncbi:MAG: heavy metal translocating P-type ATPase metal-binding domain-containing protein [Flavobacteriales bacterium]|nr:heavy metal translocating P-type ATPase metal-binding domain-containing protein [Flavobacteriales bacterium]